LFHAGDLMVKKDLVNINIKVPLTLKQILEKHVKADLHTNLSEFTRDALREKIVRDAPVLFRQLFEENHSSRSQDNPARSGGSAPPAKG
jgi:Arc/MetJ-type ribon-helix-helix transcriptional regulator